jgi:hypothetical protein
MTALLRELATEASDMSVLLFSALAKTGIDDTALLLHRWAHPEP